MIQKIKTASREEWLAERRKSLGGSDMGAVLGFNKYSSPMTVWMDKTGRLPEKEITEAIRLGNDLEDYVAKRFSEASGLKVVNDKATWRNSKYPYLHANIDRKIVGQKSGLECKTTSALNEKKYKDGKFIDSYYAQCVEYLCVTELDRWYLAVLVLGVGLHVYQMTRIPNDTVPEWCDSSVYVDDDEIQAIANAGHEFWTRYVLTNTPPPTDGSSATSEALSALYPDSSEKCIVIVDFDMDLRRRADLRQQISELDAQVADIENRIKAVMGEAGKAESTSYRVTWNSQVRNTFDHKRFASDHPGLDLSKYYKASKSRVFRVSQKG